METVLGTILMFGAGTVVVAGAVLILGFISLGALAPIGAVVHSVSAHRHPRVRSTRPATYVRHRLVPHH